MQEVLCAHGVSEISICSHDGWLYRCFVTCVT